MIFNCLQVLLILLIFFLSPVWAQSDDYETDEINYYEEEDEKKHIDTSSMIYSKHLGYNGFFADITVVFNKIHNPGIQEDSKQFSMGSGFLPNIGFGGDILTGLDFIHIIPSFHTWGYKEEDAASDLDKSRRYFSINFATSFVSPRLLERQFRLIAGVGPVIESELYYKPDESNESLELKGFSMFYGMAGRLGIELPIKYNYSFLIFLSYLRNYTFYSSFNSNGDGGTYYESQLKHERIYISVGVAL